jgi:crotonobetainyl-CoA:carnitine CoA-transferase CaiB-like acyl-CoA transferase
VPPPSNDVAINPVRAILEGLSVLEIASDRAAYAGKLLGDLGADVIVVEPPGGHASRRYGPFVDDEPDPDRCLWWWNYNTSKRSVVLDLDTEAGRTALRSLAGKADILLEAEDPGTLESLGLDHPQVRAEHPELIWVSVTPFGRQCAEFHEPTTDLTLLAGAGTAWACGYDDHSQPPIRPSGNHAHHTASAFALLGTLTAVVHRDVSGSGQHVDISMHAAVNVSTEVSTVDWLFVQSTLQRQTGRHASAHPTMEIQVAAGDGCYVTTPLALTSANNFRAALEWLRELELDAEFPEAFFLQMGIDRGGVSMKQLGVDAEVTAIYGAGREALYLIASKFSARDFFVEAQRRGIACGVVFSPEEALHDEHFQAREYPIAVEHAELGRSITYPGIPFTGTEIPATIRRAPLVGEHTDEVLGAI